MDSKSAISTLSGFLGVVFSTQITNEILNVILTILSIVSIILSLTLTIIKWWKGAKSDGKITIDETEDIISKSKEIIDKGMEDIKDEREDD